MRRLRPHNGRCACCNRSVPLTFHHLFPRKVHRRKRFQQAFSKDQLNQGIFICRLCHQGIHRRYDEVTLATRFSSLPQLLADPKLAKHFLWVGKQKERMESPHWL